MATKAIQDKKEASSPTVSLEAIISSCTIDAK